MVVAYAVYLDGKQIGSIRNDSTERFKIETGSHDLRIRIQWLSSPTVEFQIGPDDTVCFECTPKRLSPFTFLGNVFRPHRQIDLYRSADSTPPGSSEA